MQKIVIAIGALLIASVDAAAATAFLVKLPAQVYAGSATTAVVTATNGSGGTAADYTGTVHFTSSDGAATLPADYTFSPADNGTHSFGLTFNTPGVNQTLTATDVANSSITGTGATFVQYPPNVARSLGVTLPATVEHEMPVSFTVTARNAEGQSVTTFGGSVHFSGTPGITLPPDYTYVPSDQGTHTFTATFHKGGIADITASQVGSPGVDGSGGTTVVCSDYHVTAGNTGPACPGETVTLYATADHPNMSYYWTGPRSWFSTLQNPSITASTLLAGEFNVTVTDPANSCAAYATTTVALKPAPQPAVIFPQRDSSGGICSTFSPFTATAANWGSTWTNATWFITGGTITSGQGTPSITFTQTSNPVSVRLTVTDSTSGCSGEGSNIIDIKPAPADRPIQAPSPVCPNATYDATIGSIEPQTTVYWQATNAAITDTATGIRFTPDGSGPVTLSVFLHNYASSCDRTITRTIPLATPAATINAASSLCAHAHDQTADVADAGAGAMYEWTLTGGVITAGQGTRAITYDIGETSAQLAVTVRANGCTASSTKSIPLTGPRAVIADPQPICRGDSAQIAVTLTGIPPFTIQWSDGLVQSGLTSTVASRTVAPSETMAYAITDISDASCTGVPSGDVTLRVLSAPAILRDPVSTTVPPNGTATLSVDAIGDDLFSLFFRWFEGDHGDVTKPVGTNSRQFQTPPLLRTTRYWVQVTNACGVADSKTATVSILAGKSRAVRH